MVNATVGTWVNYATTAIFQVLFAARFGSTMAASTYALTFTMTIALSAIVIGTTQSVYIPRLLTRDGQLLSAGLRRVLWLLLLALLLFVAFAAAASPIADLVAGKFNGPGTDLVPLMRFAAMFGLSQVVAGQVAAVSWARGSRFLPAIAPAVPSIVASVPLATDPHLTVETVYLLLTAGSALQIVVLVAGGCRRLRLSHEPLENIGKLTFAFLGSYVVAQLMLPFEIFIAAQSSASGGADFNYAYRALAVAQLLIVGGLTMSALPEWSQYVRSGARRVLERSIAQTASVAALALSWAAGIGLVATETLVRTVFQRGSFTKHDTHVVSAILIAALLGFVAEGMQLVLSPALVADRRNRAAIAIGIARTGFVLLLVAMVGLAAGPVGVAIGYSAANAVVLAVEVGYLYRVRLVTRAESALARSTTLVAACTVGAAASSLALPLPSLARAGLVTATFVALMGAMKNQLPAPHVRISLMRRVRPPAPLQSEAVAIRPPAAERVS